MKPLSLLDVKQALWDARFRDLFPEYKEQVDEFMSNPGCSCNVDLYRKLMEHKDRLKTYFPTREIVTPKEEIEALAKNRWKVINCKAVDLERQLKKLGQGRKQIAVARWEDEVTVVINELDVLF